MADSEGHETSKRESPVTTTEGTTEGSIGVINAIFLLVNAAAGAGVLNYPKSFKVGGGIICSIIIQMVLCLLSLWGLISANVVAAEYRVMSMQDLLESTCGRFFALSVATIIFIYSVFSCTVYLVVIGDQFERVFLTLSGPKFCEKWYLNRNFAIVISSIIIILPNLFSKKMDFLKYVSRLGVFAIFYVGGMVVIEYFIINDNEKTPLEKSDSSVRVYEVILSFATICYAYHCHVQSIAILGCLKERSLKKIVFSVIVAFIIVTILYTSTGTFGYLTFGNDVQSNIILNYDPKDPIVLLAFVLLALKICSSYPVVLFCGREACIDVTCGFVGITRADHEKILRIGISATLYVFTVLTALFIPNLGTILGFLGVFVASFIFIFPGMSEFFYGFKSEIRKDKHTLSGILLILIGIILAIALLILSVYKVILTSTTTEKLCRA